jgi:hypothetical protein
VSRPIPIHLAVEDELSEWVLRRIIASRPTNYSVGAVFGKGGFGYLKRQVRAFNNAAKRCPFLLLTDLDQTVCPPQLIADWLDVPGTRIFFSELLSGRLKAGYWGTIRG